MDSSIQHARPLGKHVHIRVQLRSWHAANAFRQDTAVYRWTRAFMSAGEVLIARCVQFKTFSPGVRTVYVHDQVPR